MISGTTPALYCCDNSMLASHLFAVSDSNPVDLTATDCVWSITDTDSVVCALEDRAALQCLWNTTTAPQWQFSL